MQLNKLSISLISVLITLAMALSAFAYKTGEVNNELKNVKASIVKAEIDLKEDIKSLEEKKAEKEIVDLIFAKIEKIDKKLDRLLLEGNTK